MREPFTWARSIGLLTLKFIDVNLLVTHRMPLVRGQEAFALLVNKQGSRCS